MSEQKMELRESGGRPNGERRQGRCGTRLKNPNATPRFR